jgi:hypothetical protein
VADTLASEFTSGSSTVTLRVLVLVTLEVGLEWVGWAALPGALFLFEAETVGTAGRSLLGVVEIDRARLMI